MRIPSQNLAERMEEAADRERFMQELEAYPGTGSSILSCCFPYSSADPKTSFRHKPPLTVSSKKRYNLLQVYKGNPFIMQIMRIAGTFFEAR